MSDTQILVESNVRLVTAKMLAKTLSISDRTVWRLRSAGKLPMPITFGGSVRWRLSDIEEWLNLRCPTEAKFELQKEAK